MGKNRQVARVKDNAQPASSALAAARSSSLSSSSFFPSQSLDPATETALKHLSKRDVATQLKALDHLLSTVPSLSDPIALMKPWIIVFPVLGHDSDKRIRQQALKLTLTLVEQLKKESVPYLSNILPIWIGLMHDTACQSLAKEGMERLFPGDKSNLLLKRFQRDILVRLKQDLEITLVQLDAEQKNESNPLKLSLYWSFAINALGTLMQLGDIKQDEDLFNTQWQNIFNLEWMQDPVTCKAILSTANIGIQKGLTVTESIVDWIMQCGLTQGYCTMELWLQIYRKLFISFPSLWQMKHGHVTWHRFVLDSLEKETSMASAVPVFIGDLSLLDLQEKWLHALWKKRKSMFKFPTIWYDCLNKIVEGKERYEKNILFHVLTEGGDCPMEWTEMHLPVIEKWLQSGFEDPWTGKPLTETMDISLILDNLLKQVIKMELRLQMQYFQSIFVPFAKASQLFHVCLKLKMKLPENIETSFLDYLKTCSDAALKEWLQVESERLIPFLIENRKWALLDGRVDSYLDEILEKWADWNDEKFCQILSQCSLSDAQSKLIFDSIREIPCHQGFLPLLERLPLTLPKERIASLVKFKSCSLYLRRYSIQEILDIWNRLNDKEKLLLLLRDRKIVFDHVFEWESVDDEISTLTVLDNSTEMGSNELLIAVKTQCSPMISTWKQGLSHDLMTRYTLLDSSFTISHLSAVKVILIYAILTGDWYDWMIGLILDFEIDFPIKDKLLTPLLERFHDYKELLSHCQCLSSRSYLVKFFNARTSVNRWQDCKELLDKELFIQSQSLFPLQEWMEHVSLPRHPDNHSALQFLLLQKRVAASEESLQQQWQLLDQLLSHSATVSSLLRGLDILHWISLSSVSVLKDAAWDKLLDRILLLPKFEWRALFLYWMLIAMETVSETTQVMETLLDWIPLQKWPLESSEFLEKWTLLLFHFDALNNYRSSLTKWHRLMVETNHLSLKCLSSFILLNSNYVEGFDFSGVDFITFLLAWLLLLNGSGRVTKDIAPLMEAIFPILTEGSRFFVMETFDFASFLLTPSLPHLSAFIYYLALLKAPHQVRDWFQQQSKSNQMQWRELTSKYFTPLLVRQQGTACKSLQGLEMTVTQRYVVAQFVIDDMKLSIKVSFPLDYPLTPCTIESDRIGLTSSQSHTWLRLFQTALYCGVPLNEALIQWRDRAKDKFDGVEPCPICYSVIASQNKQLPDKKCRTCQNAFHASCLFQWFGSRGDTSCPLCRNVW